MKTLTIERPSGLDQMTREITWRYNGLDLRDVSRETLIRNRLLAVVTGDSRSPAIVGQYVKSTQLLSGALMVVDQRVSRDLELSAIVGDLAHLVWPAESLEIRFQDPGLPAIIACSGGVKDGLGAPGVAFVIDAKNGETITTALRESLWKRYTSGDYDSLKSPEEPMGPGESVAMRYMAVLAIKVLAYASIPQHAPALLSTKADRKEAGLHPKHAHPGQKTLCIRYLPHVIRPKAPAGEPTGLTHQFMGRAGVLRFYKDERYINMRGKWQWLPPIHPPEGVTVIYRVRKVAQFIPTGLSIE